MIYLDSQYTWKIKELKKPQVSAVWLLQLLYTTLCIFVQVLRKPVWYLYTCSWDLYRRMFFKELLATVPNWKLLTYLSVVAWTECGTYEAWHTAQQWADHYYMDTHSQIANLPNVQRKMTWYRNQIFTWSSQIGKTNGVFHEPTKRW